MTSPLSSPLMLITGASRGIGAACAVAAAKAGYDVVVNYAGNHAAAEQVAEHVRAEGQRAIIAQADIRHESQILKLFEVADKEFGRLDVLVNNAGITGNSCRMEQVSAKMLDALMAINVIGSVLCAREAIKRMSTKQGGDGGSIINMSSRAAKLGSGGEWVHYAMSKGAIDTMTTGLAHEVANDGIRVNAVSPGLIETDIHQTSSIPDRLATLTQGVPLQRVGTAEEVAAAVIWLASDAASYVTGANLDVGGGR